MTTDDLIHREREGDELPIRSSRPYRTIWARQAERQTVSAELLAELARHTERVQRERRIPAYHLLPAGWRRGGTLPAGFDPETGRPC